MEPSHSGSHVVGKALVVTRAPLPGVISPFPPLWATDHNETIPVGALRVPNLCFFIGNREERHAFVIGANHWHEHGDPELRLCAQKAWLELTGEDPDAVITDAVVAGWRECASRSEN
jgi:hypothetical protein